MIASLPMYDWPEVRGETDAQWRGIREALARQGLDAPESLARRNADLPAVPGGIQSSDGSTVAPDPATLPPDEIDLAVLFRHPQLLLAQTCWGPMELGLAKHVRVVGQPDYSRYEGGHGVMYRSAVLMRRKHGLVDVAVPANPGPNFDAGEIRSKRFAFNGPDSMSGIIAIRRDLQRAGLAAGAAGFNRFWSEMIETGGHRQSVVAVTEGRADVAAVDCRTLDLCRRFEPATGELRVVGWTAERLGLPYVTATANVHPISLSSHG